MLRVIFSVDILVLCAVGGGINNNKLINIHEEI